MTEFTTLAESTIACSAYNLLALGGGPIKVPSLYALACKGHEEQLPMDNFISAVNALVERGYVEFDEDAGTMRALGPKGALVRWRDLSGDGWQGWTVDLGKDGARALKEVLP